MTTTKQKRKHLTLVTGIPNDEWSDEAIEKEYYYYFQHNNDHVEVVVLDD